jgi:hypothetical protein
MATWTSLPFERITLTHGGHLARGGACSAGPALDCGAQAEQSDVPSTRHPTAPLVRRAVRDAIDARATGSNLRAEPAGGWTEPPSAQRIGHRDRFARRAVCDAPRRPRTTLRYDTAKTNLDRYAGLAVAAYLAGIRTG